MPCRLGLHARTAAGLVGFLKQFRSQIRIRRGRQSVDGKSILGLLVLGASWNSKLAIEAEGEDAEQAIQGVKGYFLISGHCVDEVS